MHNSSLFSSVQYAWCYPYHKQGSPRKQMLRIADSFWLKKILFFNNQHMTQSSRAAWILWKKYGINKYIINMNETIIQWNSVIFSAGKSTKSAGSRDSEPVYLWWGCLLSLPFFLAFRLAGQSGIEKRTFTVRNINFVNLWICGTSTTW